MARPSTGSMLLAAALLIGTVSAGCSRSSPPPASKTFETPEAAVQALSQAAAASSLADLISIFGPEGQDLVDTSDPDTARRNRQVFTAAMAEGWELADEGGHKVLVVGNEEWPFPVPLVKDARGWRFDTVAGKEEVLARRIGRNELAVIRICKAYVAAQRLYAATGHDGGGPGVYAASFRSDAGKQNGLYWHAEKGAPRSPLGELIQEAEQRESAQGTPEPFHGYYFRILTAQGATAPGGAKDYLVNGRLTGGFGLIAWPAHYDGSGVMTFIVNQDGVVYQKDLGPQTDAAVARLTTFDPDMSWAGAQ